MTRNALILSAALMLSVGAAWAETPTLTETSSGVYVAVHNTSANPSIPAGRLYLSLARSHSVAVAVDNMTPQQAIRKIRQCHNNIYAMAINSEGISRATHAVRTSRGVRLVGPSVSGSGPRLAQK
jgi:hypothetical protein